MSLKVFLVAAFISFVSAGILEPAPATLRLAVSAPAPVVSLVSPAVTKTEYTPGSYSSSYRSDTITPRVKYTETPGVSITVPQPTVTRVEHLAPVIPEIERVERIVPALQTVARLESLPSVSRIEHIASAPLLETRTFSAIPSIPRVEHLAQTPLVARVEHVASPFLTERIVPGLTTFARVEPSIAKTFTFGAATPIVRSELGLAAYRTPSTYTYGIGGLDTREIAFGQKIHF